ncbi:MAG TPA: O-antigen ligase family protein, partial [Pseudosphingobacterium sp.]|nr:O-antigen ligase family protein [Pseudosphingobacterium sp.]
MWIAIFMSFGYPLQSALPLIFGLSTEIFNFGFRAMYSMGLIICLVYLCVNQKMYRWRNWQFALAIFFIFYIFRIIHDVSLLNIKFSGRPPYWVYSMLIGNGLLPFIVTGCLASYFSLKVLVNRAYCIAFITNIILIVIIYLQYGSILSPELYSHRVHIYADGDAEGMVINSILIGTYGNILTIMSLFQIIFMRDKTKLMRITFWCGFFLGFLLMVIAASRGPVVYFILISLLTYFYFMYKNGKSISKVLGFTLIAMAVCFTVFIVFSNKIEDTAFYKRFNVFFEQRENDQKEGRDFEWASAWEQFLDYPIFGDRYLN